MHILIDLDGVLAQWDRAFDDMLDFHGESAVGIPRAHERYDWNLKADRTFEERRIIDSIMTLPHFYEGLEPAEGARESLRTLVDMGHDVHIVTAPFVSNPTCASDKLAWVEKHIGHGWAQRVVLTTDKTLVRGDILIDDKPVITGSREPDWKRIIFGDYAYNRNVINVPRLSSWDMPSVMGAIREAVRQG